MFGTERLANNGTRAVRLTVARCLDMTVLLLRGGLAGPLGAVVKMLLSAAAEWQGKSKVPEHLSTCELRVALASSELEGLKSVAIDR